MQRDVWLILAVGVSDDAPIAAFDTMDEAAAELGRLMKLPTSELRRILEDTPTFRGRRKNTFTGLRLWFVPSRELPKTKRKGDQCKSKRG